MDKVLLTKMIDGGLTEVESALALTKLCSMLKDYYGSKVVVLIDEYDSMINSMTDPVLRREILDFLKEMLSSLLKGNDSLQLGVVSDIT